VLSPGKGSTPRYSIPFFQNIAQNIRLAESVLDCMLLFFFHAKELARYISFILLILAVFLVPPEVLKLKEQRGEPVTTDCR